MKRPRHERSSSACALDGLTSSRWYSPCPVDARGGGVEGRRSLRTLLGVVVVGLLCGALVTACNPLTNTTIHSRYSSSSTIESFRYTGAADGWVEVRLTSATPSPTTTKFHVVAPCIDCTTTTEASNPDPPEILAFVAMSVDHAVECIGDKPDRTDSVPAPCTSVAPGRFVSPARVVWSHGASTDFRRLIEVSPGQSFDVVLSETTPTTADVGVVNDAGVAVRGNVVPTFTTVASAIS